MFSEPTPLTSASYMEHIVSTVDKYKDERNRIERMFDASPHLPDASLTPLGDTAQSDSRNPKQKRDLYQWSTEGGSLPYLKQIPRDEQVGIFKIFDVERVWAVTGGVPGEIYDFFSGLSDGKVTMDSIEKQYEDLHAAAVAPDSDWYTDAVFGQQYLTGVNPTGLTQASSDWVSAFSQVASDQKNTSVQEILSTSPSPPLYVVDNSDYRHILGLGADATIISPSLCGKLHPLAICLDYKGSLKAGTSVTIFNKRLTPNAKGVNEKTDWPWRYAKMCVSVSDWARHELSVHLTETHLLEEALIVAAQRNFPDSHILDQVKTFVRQSYMNFDFSGRYVPKARGFDPSHLDGEIFHNSLYARNIHKCWDAIHTFVSDVLHGAYPNGDAGVLADTYIAGFCAEMRSQGGGQLPSFPIVKSLEELVDVGDHLRGYTEDSLIDSLPMSGVEDKTEWMFMAQVPYLLSAEVDPENSIEDYAQFHQGEQEPYHRQGYYNQGFDDKVALYHVLDPKLIAQSILT
ncbi:Lipoxygenase [Coprinellus micaceus]|uniref:Manganese lipoxygenase n=1 Tax=Coprinellus micaceus TaxID=71717 RepID=A0A4Y7RWM6_COPMI|nr:Lipoxygenase [Coprinellus micaceus]